MHFRETFRELTGYLPFPWQEGLFQRFVDRDIPSTCIIPTGLGKTNLIAIWLVAVASGLDVPRRLVYVVNRRTVVDQTTNEAERLRLSATNVGIPKLAISTLRGQFEDNREWYSDPSVPAIICGTVDMVGSRILFSGYGIGWKSRPLHAGFLGQDVLLIHDEAHLEPVFQNLLTAIQAEQKRCADIRPMKVLELTATTRSAPQNNCPIFELTAEEKSVPEVVPAASSDEPPLHKVWRRMKAVKRLSLVGVADDRQVPDQIAGEAQQIGEKAPGSAVLVFARRLDDVAKIQAQLISKKSGIARENVQLLTGTLRGYERDQLVKSDPVFRRFMPKGPSELKTTPRGGTVYLICTSAGEVGVDISADHMVCDLSTFESMAQRFGRVNRYGESTDTQVIVVHPEVVDQETPLAAQRTATLQLLRKLDDDASPWRLQTLSHHETTAAFAPSPEELRVTDILFDAWALTSVRGKLPGRPPVEPFLHGLSDWEPPQTKVAWRAEVDTKGLELTYHLGDLLDDYPLKPHELLQDTTLRVYEALQKIAARYPDRRCWILDEQGSVRCETLGMAATPAADAMGKKRQMRQIEDCTIVLPPSVGGLANGMLDGDSLDTVEDVADEWLDGDGLPRRLRAETDEPDKTPQQRGMSVVRIIDYWGDEGELPHDESAGSGSKRYWIWCVKPRDVEDATKASLAPVRLDQHLDDTRTKAEAIVKDINLPAKVKEAVVFAAAFHDLGKERRNWQLSIGNPNPGTPFAKSGKPDGEQVWKPIYLGPYRHEFGSVLDLNGEGVYRKQLGALSDEMADLVLHMVAAHHGRARPHFPLEEVQDFGHAQANVEALAEEIPRRFARLQRKYGRWGLAYLESLVRAADWAASGMSAEEARVEDLV